MQFMGLKYSLSPFNGVLFLTSMVSGHYKVDNCYTWFFPCEIYSVAQLSINSPRIQVSIQTPRRCGSLYEIAPKEREEPVQMMREIATTAKWRVFHLQLWCPRFIAGPALAWRFPLREWFFIYLSIPIRLGLLVNGLCLSLLDPKLHRLCIYHPWNHLFRVLLGAWRLIRGSVNSTKVGHSLLLAQFSFPEPCQTVAPSLLILLKGQQCLRILFLYSCIEVITCPTGKKLRWFIESMPTICVYQRPPIQSPKRTRGSLKVNW